MLWVKGIWVSSFRIRRRWASVACLLPTSNEAAQPSVPSARPWESEVFHWHQIRFSASFWHCYEYQFLSIQNQEFINERDKTTTEFVQRYFFCGATCHMVRSACRMSPWKVALLSQHANNTGWTAKVQLVISLSRVASCLHAVAYLLVSHFCISYSHWHVALSLQQKTELLARVSAFLS